MELLQRVFDAGALRRLGLTIVNAQGAVRAPLVCATERSEMEIELLLRGDAGGACSDTK